MILRLILIMGVGGAFALLLPREGIIDGSTRIIPFFALLMAGVLPAMMQTVTVLKGDDLSPRAVNEYGLALQEQLEFWASLFASALSAVGSLTLAVILHKSPDLTPLPGNYFIRMNFIVDILIFIFGCTAANVISKVIAAYGGLKSLLKLNLKLAENKSKRAAEKAGKALLTPASPLPPEPRIREI